MKRIFISLLIVVSFVSCKRIPLYDPSSGIYLKPNIILNTGYLLNEDLHVDETPYLRDKVYGKMPEAVRACIYDAETHAMIAEEFMPPTGGFIHIAPGTYDIIVYSLGTEETQVTSARGTGYAYTGNVGTKMTVSSHSAETGELTVVDQNVIYEPDHIFVGQVEGVVIPVMAPEDPPIIIECDMPTLVQSYSFEVINVVGAGNIQVADVYITGQAPSRFLWDGHRPNGVSAIYFPVEVNVEKGHIYSVFNTFGKYPGMTNNCYLNVLVTTGGGGKYQWIFDITDQFDDPDNTHHEIIIDEDVIVPGGGPETEGGFIPVVEDWDPVIIYVPLQ